MFHNTRIPPQMRDIFSLPDLPFEQLPEDIQTWLVTRYGMHYCVSACFSPPHATTPTSFKWSVILAPVAMTTENENAYHTMRANHLWLAPKTQFLCEAHTPFILDRHHPNVMLILDYEAIITCDWPKELVLQFCPEVRKWINVAGIPIAWSKSSFPTMVVTIYLSFIGHVVDFFKRIMFAAPYKWGKIERDI